LGFVLFLAVLYALLALVARRRGVPVPVPPIPPPPIPPGPAPPVTEGTTVMTLTNNEWSDGVIFCRGPIKGSMAKVFLDADMRQPAVGSDYDVSDPESTAAQKWGEGVPGGCTLALGLSQGSSATLYIAGNGTWPSGACWFQDVESNARASLAKGPQYMSQVEFTIDKSGEGSVWYDMSSVEGVSGGITMNYTDELGNTQTDVASMGLLLFISTPRQNIPLHSSSQAPRPQPAAAK